MRPVAGSTDMLPPFPGRRRRAHSAGLAFVFVWFLVGGLAHFFATDLEMRIVPPSLPWPRAVVLVSGVCELAGAVALLVPATRRVAGWALVALTIAVTPANVYMLQTAALWPVPYWALVARLPFQLVLLAVIVWSTGPRSQPKAASTSR